MQGFLHMNQNRLTPLPCIPFVGNILYPVHCRSQNPEQTLLPIETKETDPASQRTQYRQFRQQRSLRFYHNNQASRSYPTSPQTRHTVYHSVPVRLVEIFHNFESSVAVKYSIMKPP